MDPYRHMLLAIYMVTMLAHVAVAQTAPGTAVGTVAGSFIDITPGRDIEPVWLATTQVVRIGRVEDYTIIDTAAWVQQRTVEPVEALARRLTSAGQRLIALTDLSGRRIYLSADRIVLVREAQGRYAAGARTAIVMVGLRFNSDVAVRETVQEVMTALRREARGGAPSGSATGEAP